MGLTQDDEMIHALAPDRSDQPFDNTILPGRGRRSRPVPDAHNAQPVCDDRTVDTIPVPDHVARSPILRKSLGDLTRNPLRCRAARDVDPNEISAMKSNDNEGIEQFEANGRDNEQIHGAVSGAWLPRKVRHPWLGGSRRLTMYLAIVD